MNKIIIGKRIYLKELCEDDASQQYCDWLNNPDVNKYMTTKKTTIEELKQYIGKKVNDSNCLFFGIYLKEKNKHIGNIKLEPINFIEKNATLGIMIGNKKYWGQGLCNESIKLLVNHTFNSLDLIEIRLGVISENIAAIISYLKSGFKIVGIDYNAIQYGCNTYDNIVMSIKNNKGDKFDN